MSAPGELGAIAPALAEVMEASLEWASVATRYAATRDDSDNGMTRALGRLTRAAEVYAQVSDIAGPLAVTFIVSRPRT